MSVTFNWNTVLSSFDERGTLLKQLKSMEDTFETAGMTGCEVVDPTDTSLKLKFTFADGSSLTTAAIDIKGAKGDKGDTGNTGPQGPQGEPGGITNVNGYTGAVTTGNGLTFNNGALNAIDLNLTNSGFVTMANLTVPTGYSSLGGYFRYALNADKTIGKLYGYVSISAATVTENLPFEIDTGIIVAQPEADYTMYPGLMAMKTDGKVGFGFSIKIKTNGHVYLQSTLTPSQGAGTWWMMFPACLYFFKDFGDIPEALTLSMRMAAMPQDPIEEPSER